MQTENSTHNEYIIALGASAGAMQAIHTFFDCTPMDNVSYVIVQHLSPDYKSRMAELLSKHSKLKICEVKNNMLVESNQVYIIPNDKIMRIKNRRLKLEDKEKNPIPKLTVDTFFDSLAADIGDKAIGVILSGAGSDGIHGVKSIKEAGGLIIAQDPSTADYDGMPQNAISTGLVDLVLPPSLMPRAIENYVKTAKINVYKSKSEEEEDVKILDDIILQVKEQSSLDFSSYKKSTIQRRVNRRVASHNLGNIKEYRDFLNQNSHELEVLAKDFLISVTSFFRDPEAFQFIKEHVIPNILKLKEPVKVWIAGCATGEEAYSIAILFKELLEDKFIPDIKIFATDIDSAALDFASNGIYGEHIQKNVSKERLDKYFTAAGTSYKIKPDLRKMVVFARHDLVKNPPYCNVDLIVCRNLLMYMNSNLQKKVLSMLHFGLKKDGYLFLGTSENAVTLIPSLKEIDSKWKIYQNVTLNRSVQFSTSMPFEIPEPEPEALLSKRVDNISIPSRDKLAGELNEFLMSEYGYAAVCIDEKYEVMYTFGDVKKYLLQKILQLNLIELLPKSLVVAFNSALKTLTNTKEKVIIRNIRIKKDGKIFWVDLSLMPTIVKANESPKQILVMFQDSKVDQNTLSNSSLFDEQAYINEYVTNLEEELRVAKESMKLMQAKLYISNENMQSFNEELLSANEEMQSAYQEMQSINTELEALNVSYQKKNAELADLNDDLNNYFGSNINGQLFIDKNMLLKKFSPAAARLVNLIESDIGRPIDHLTTKIKYPILKDDIKGVISTGKVISTEVESFDNKWYQLRIMPYVKEKEHKKAGAIIAFNDITELKKIQKELDLSNKRLELINSDLDNFVYAASHDLMLPLNNIQSLTQLLTEAINKKSPDVKRYISMIYSATMRFKSTLREMSDLGKIEAEMQLGNTEVNFNEIIEDIKKQINATIVSTNTKIHVKLDAKEVMFSKKNLRCILFNLISNAIKHKSPDRDPKINIVTQKVPEFILMSVKDNGKGIKEEDIERVFGMYQRADNDADGSGIGLYLLRKIINATGGKVEVESEVGVGSTFRIFFKD